MSPLPDPDRRAHPAPHYRRLKEHVLALIDAGSLKPGERIPSEADLVQLFSVSRMTANRALKELESEGAIRRVQGLGSFVATRTTEAAPLEIRDIATQVRQGRQAYTCRVLRLEASRESAANRLLGLPARARHWRSTVLHLADGVPIQWEDRRVNPAFAPDYLMQDFTVVTTHDYLMSLGPLQGAEHAFAAEIPDGEQAALLQMEPGEPCLVLRRRTWSRDQVATYALLAAPNGRYRYAGSFGTLPASAQALPPV